MVLTQNAAGLQDLQLPLIWDVLVQEAFRDHVLSVGKQTNLPLYIGFILSWAMEMSHWSGGALHDPASVVDLNVGIRCTRNGFRGHEMPLAMRFFMQDLGNVLLCLKTFLLRFLESSVTKLRLHFKSRRREDKRSLKLGSLDDVQSEMWKQWFAADRCEQFPLIPGATKGWRRKEPAGGHGPELWNLLLF